MKRWSRDLWSWRLSRKIEKAEGHMNQPPDNTLVSGLLFKYRNPRAHVNVRNIVPSYLPTTRAHTHTQNTERKAAKKNSSARRVDHFAVHCLGLHRSALHNGMHSGGCSSTSDTLGVK